MNNQNRKKFRNWNLGKNTLQIKVQASRFLSFFLLLTGFVSLKALIPLFIVNFPSPLLLAALIAFSIIGLKGLKLLIHYKIYSWNNLSGDFSITEHRFNKNHSSHFCFNDIESLIIRKKEQRNPHSQSSHPVFILYVNLNPALEFERVQILNSSSMEAVEQGLSMIESLYRGIDEPMPQILTED